MGSKFTGLREEAIKRGNFVCSGCERELPASEFKNNKADGVLQFSLAGRCSECRNLTYKFSKLKANYGITREEYTNLYNSQGGRCAVCNRSIEFTSNVRNRNNIGNLDHDHKTGKIRGLLCNDCNRAIGFFKEDKNLILSAYNYLVVHNKSDKLLETPEEDNQQPITSLND